jgi:hypothetical protein
MAEQAQVHVLVPLGLEMVGGGHAVTGGEGAEQLPPDQAHFKEILIKNITEAVREHVEKKTAAAVDALWQKGQRAQQQLQQQQASQLSQLQGQLDLCAKGHQQLEHQNALLRGSLEMLMMHLSMFGVPPDGLAPAAPTTPLGPLSRSPFFGHCGGVAGSNSCVSIPNAAETASTMDNAARTSVIQGPPGLQNIDEIETCGGDVTDVGDDVAQEQRTNVGDEVAAAAAAKNDVSQPVTPTSKSEQIRITLRRADAVPLGLHLNASGSSYLTVEAIRPGGAVDAWNRQCDGDMRQIKPGDRIVAINSVEGVQGMREECLTKHLLKLALVRAPVFPGKAGTTAAAPPLSAAAAVVRSLRADADEFVPKPAVQAGCKD